MERGKEVKDSETGQSRLNLDGKITDNGHTQWVPLPIVNRFRQRNRSPVAVNLKKSRLRTMICTVLGAFSELGSNQVVSRVLAQFDAIALAGTIPLLATAPLSCK